jgi:DNA-binding CsgD family transcriptional regulator
MTSEVQPRPGGSRRSSTRFQMIPNLAVIARVSPRQYEILNLISLGFGDKEIAAQLGVSAHTVRSHLTRLFREHRLHSRAALVAAWIRGNSALGAPPSGPA